MRIFAIGDFHGKFPRKLIKRIEKENPDLILSPGDYTGIDEWRPLIKKQFKELAKGKECSIEKYLGKKKYDNLLKKDYIAGKRILQELNKQKTKVFSVFGNGDWYKILFNDTGKFYEKEIKKLEYIKNINRGKAIFNGIKITGFGGYLDPDIYFTKKGMKAINSDKKDFEKRKKRYAQNEKELVKLMRKRKRIKTLNSSDKNGFRKNKKRSKGNY
ncbi:MAG: metallophosphoesterase [Candidatus Pacearchaeota archaeon]|nr:metallophosphoesterase [Candidatus Pacearchaeota archaeon]